uniref:Uncharacterized protein n=1 Tax=Octopus bimaculoides TaxID=37653 RepID=A0A0L8FXQ9_OCTBM
MRVGIIHDTRYFAVTYNWDVRFLVCGNIDDTKIVFRTELNQFRFNIHHPVTRSDNQGVLCPVVVF